MLEAINFHKKTLIKLNKIIASTNDQFTPYDKYIPKQLLADHMLELREISYEMSKYISNLYQQLESLEKHQ